MLEEANEYNYFSRKRVYRLYPEKNDYSYVKIGDRHYSSWEYHTDFGEGQSFSDAIEGGEKKGTAFYFNENGGKLLSILYRQWGYSGYQDAYGFLLKDGETQLTNISLYAPKGSYSFIDVIPVTMGFLETENLLK